MDGKQPTSGYRSYILRVWKVEHDDRLAVVAVLEDCQTDERRAFSSLTALMEFLEADGSRPLAGAHDDSQCEE